MWDVELYRSADGDCPAREFLSNLHSKDELPYAMRAIELLREFGHQLRRPHAETLQDGIHELRIRVKRKQLRLLYFFFYQEKIMISHGLRKESRIPAAEIQKAGMHKADYFSRNERSR